MSVLKTVMDAVKSVATLMALSSAVAILAMNWTLMEFHATVCYDNYIKH